MNVVKEEAPANTAPSHEERHEGKTITMAMIAKAAGVSQGAISSLLNDRDYGIRVSSKTRERVFRVCREMGYIPNDLRAVVRMYPEKGELCLLVDQALGLDDPTADQLFKALVREGLGHPVTLALYHPTQDYKNHPKALPEPILTGIASKFITIGTPNPTLSAAIIEREHPLVHIGQDGEVPGVTGLNPDYVDASRRAVEYLFSKGHRHIVILSGPFGSTEPAIADLNNGIREGYKAVHIPIEAQNIIYGEMTFEHGAASLELLWQREQKPTAIFCFSDLVAAGVLHRAQERGITVPEELSVVGCGNSPCSLWLHPPLTTVALPIEQLAERALEEIQTRLKEQDYLSGRLFSLPNQIIERASCAALTP